MGGQLVVVGPGVVRAQVKRARFDQHVAAGRHRPRTASGVWKTGERDGLEHRLAVLAFVLENEAEDEAVREQRVVGETELGHLEDGEAPVADAKDVVARRRRVEERQLTAAVARVAERVVELLSLGEQRREAADPLADPGVLEVTDVREIPDERRLERRPLARQLLVGERLEEREGRGPCLGQLGGDGCPAIGRDERHGLLLPPRREKRTWGQTSGNASAFPRRGGPCPGRDEPGHGPGVGLS